MTDPWLSVLMPIYNGAVTLPRTLESLPVLESGIEVIAVVQAGEDGSRDQLKAFPGLRLIDAPQSKSWMENTNIAMRAASASLVTMLHQDDLWRPGRAETLREMARQTPEAKLWVHGADYIDANDRVVGHLSPPFGSRARLVPSGEALRRLLVQNTVALPAAMFRRDDALADGGLEETLWYTADWELWLRLARMGPVAWEPRALAAFRIHAGSQTVTGSRNSSDFKAQLEQPVARHLEALTGREQRQVKHWAELSNRVNVALAGAYHGQRRELARSLVSIAALGPCGMRSFLESTRLVARVLPRLRLNFRQVVE